MSRRARITLRLLAAVLGLLLVSAAILTWRLSNSPLEATYLTPYIESGFDHYLPGTHTRISRTLTSWNNIEHVVTLHADGITITDKDNHVIAEIPDLYVELSALGILGGRLLPLGLSINDPHFKLIRDNYGVLRFGDFSTESSDITADQNVKSFLSPLLHDLVHAHHTRKLNVKGVLLDVHDNKSQSDWSVHIPEINIERNSLNLAGNALLSVTQKDQISTLQIDYKYDRKNDLHVLQTNLTGITPSFFAGGHPGTLGLGALSIVDLPLTGTASIAFDSNVNIKTVNVDIHGDAGNLVYPDFWDQPRSVKKVDIKATYNHDAPEVNLASVALDFDGPLLNIMAKGGPSAVPEHDANFEIAVTLDNWPMDQFGQLWPKPVITDPREWIIKSLSKGSFDHGEATFQGALSWNDISNATIAEGSGIVTATGARVDYLEGLPVVDSVSAKATFDMDHMTIDLSSGGIGALRLVPFSIVMSDFQKDTQTMYIPLNFTGPLTSVLKVIDVPRLGYARAIGVTPEDVTGMANALIELRFPLLNTLEMKDVELKGRAELTDVASSKLVNKVDITQGNVVLNLDKIGFDVKGNAVLNKVPNEVVWKESFEAEPGKSFQQGTLKSAPSEEEWKLLNIDALKGTHGPVTSTINILMPTKTLTIITGNFDLAASEIHMDQLNWKKPAGVPAQLNITANIPDNDNINLKSIELTGPQGTAKGSAVLSPEADELVSLSLNPLLAGRTDISLKYEEMDDADKTLRFEANGKSLDISGLKGGHDVAANDPRPKEYHVNVGSLYTNEKGVITNAEGYAIRDPQGWNQINLKGLADGDTPLTIDLGAKEGKRFFAANSDNFGKALKGLGITDTVKDGKIQIVGQSSVENPRVIDGHVKVTSFTVSGLPALAILLNATSPFGFQNLISGNMGFDRMKGNFRWQGDMIELNDVHMPGPAVGLEVEGKVDMNAGTADLHGVVAPFSMVNNILGAIPLIGDVLTGGNGGGLFAVAYTITGDLNSPKVSVNPASLLTPGILRKLFFSSSEDSDEAPATTQLGAQPPQQPNYPTSNNFNKQ